MKIALFTKFARPIVGLLAGVLLASCGADEYSAAPESNSQPVAYPTVDDSFLSALEWRFVSPYRGGRVVAVAGHPDDPQVYYFGAAHGGVWKTTDDGQHWKSVR